MFGVDVHRQSDYLLIPDLFEYEIAAVFNIGVA